MSQVAVTEVAVVPVFKGFRKVVTNETDGAAKTAATGFSRTFAKTGTDSGKTVGAGFKKAFEQSAQGTSTKVTKALEADVAKTSRALSAARLKEQDAIGKVRLAQAQLNLVARLLERLGSLPTPNQLRELARTEPGVLAPTSQMRTFRDLEPPSPDEGFAAVEHVPAGIEEVVVVLLVPGQLGAAPDQQIVPRVLR